MLNLKVGKQTRGDARRKRYSNDQKTVVYYKKAHYKKVT